MDSKWRAEVVAEARSWLGTPYQHAQATRGVAVDCGMLLVRVYVNLGIAPAFDPRPYPAQWYMHQTEEKYIGWLKKYCDKIDASAVRPADIALYRFGRCAAHGAIIVDDDHMIHAYMPAKRVELRMRNDRMPHGTLDSYWSPRVQGDPITAGAVACGRPPRVVQET
jgi:NlpC/P60 family putative phage cell wall peptidase